ncbi:MAG: response regulator transcription factor [Pseudomonadota bacterium]
MHILLIEDDIRIIELLSRWLEAEGYEVTRAQTGSTGLYLARTGPFDAIILDVMLPDMDGLEVCRTLRMERNTIPILMLSALDTTDDIVKGLHLGADDYMTKPFVFDELFARLYAILRRAGEVGGPGEAVLRAGDLEFDREALRVTRGGDLISLTPLEYALLEFLMVEAGKVVTRTQILQNVWGAMEDPLTNVVDVYIRRLRTKIDAGNSDLIMTVRGRGYRFADPT